MTWKLPCLLSIVLLTMPVFASGRQLLPVRGPNGRSVVNDKGERRSIGERRPLKYGKKWQKATPEECGFNSSTLAKIPELIKSRNMGTTGLMIVVGGKEMYTYGDIEQVSYIASCRKSVLSMLYGKYVRNGTIKLDETVGALGIDDVGGLLPSEKLATVRDLISARSGCYHPAVNTGGHPRRKGVGAWCYGAWHEVRLQQLGFQCGGNSL